MFKKQLLNNKRWFSKIWGAILKNPLLFARSWTLLSQPLALNGIQTSAPWNKPEFFKTWEAVSKNSFLLSSELPDVFTTSDSRWDKSSIFGNKPKFTKNLRSNFRKFLLISWCWTLLSQPLFYMSIFKNKRKICLLFFRKILFFRLIFFDLAFSYLDKQK